MARAILIVVNILLAIAFVYFAAVDWGRRHAWSFAVFQHDVALQGLPIDSDEKDAEGDREVDRLTPGLLKNLFGSDNPVKTQKEEVEARYTQVRQAIDGAADDNARRQELIRVLQSLARTGAQRDAYAEMNLEDLNRELDAAFRGAKDGKDSAGKDLERDQRRQAIAHVLVNLSDDPNAQERVRKVVGLNAYTQEADRTATALNDMAARLETAMANDRGTFEAEHKALLHRIFLLAERVSDLKNTLAAHKAMSEKHSVLVNSRKADQKDWENRLAVAKKEAATALAEQTRLEQELMATQRALGEAMEKNQQLERDIRSQERGR
jgi:hypothetical protein